MSQPANPRQLKRNDTSQGRQQENLQTLQEIKHLKGKVALLEKTIHDLEYELAVAKGEVKAQTETVQEVLAEVLAEEKVG